MLQSYPKGKTEEGQAEMFHRSMGKRRASHQSSEHDLEEQITEWANMTWFLLALGGVCLQRPKPAVTKNVQPINSSNLPTIGNYENNFNKMFIILKKKNN